MSSTAFVAFTVVFGYVMLWSVRARIGSVGMGLASYPIGLAGTLLIAVLHAMIRMPWTPLSFGLSALVITAATNLLSRTVRDPDASASSFRPWTAVVAIVVAATPAAVVGASGRFFATADSWANYETMGMRLHDVGAWFPRLMEERSPLVPAIHAANRVFGGDVLYAAYPVMGVWLLALVYRAVARHSLESQRTTQSTVAALLATSGLAFSAAFVLQSLYIHSHMVSALFLCFALVALSESLTGDSAIWALLGGLGVAAFALARPDGLSYAALLLFIGFAATGARASWRGGTRAFLGGFWVPVAMTYGTAFAQLGLWDTAKLNGTLAAVSLAALAALSLVGYSALALLKARRAGFVRALPALGVLLATALVLTTTYLRPGGFLGALQPMLGNLFDKGGYGTLWYVAVMVLAMSACVPELRRGSPTRWIPIAALVLFMETALVIHGMTHQGHLGWTDSFNRIAFHAAPLVWWIFGGLTATALGQLTGRRTSPDPASHVSDVLT